MNTEYEPQHLNETRSTGVLRLQIMSDAETIAATADPIMIAMHDAVVRNIDEADRLNKAPLHDDTIIVLLRALQNKGRSMASELAHRGDIRRAIVMRAQADMIDRYLVKK